MKKPLCHCKHSEENDTFEAIDLLKGKIDKMRDKISQIKLVLCNHDPRIAESEVQLKSFFDIINDVKSESKAAWKSVADQAEVIGLLTKRIEVLENQPQPATLVEIFEVKPPVEPVVLAAVEQVVVEPAPVEPAVVEPAAVEQVAVQPAAVEPAVEQPAVEQVVEQPVEQELAAVEEPSSTLEIEKLSAKIEAEIVALTQNTFKYKTTDGKKKRHRNRRH
ncbi:MAG: hypothetical protein Hyperionvirus7_27 [Hyperionvirus sp.]|uniref:Uncharacterized protein n=1 Tax=Hyperionvirus sp. TaxID=2487770 RepID=A0A3G5A852_9VIRU|nr:MAG: hypothetical protein Hyperionvirus7_27 [Hyperionvirus sp.]